MGYASDLNDREWEMIKHHFDVGKYGNRSKYAKRVLVNAVLYLLKTGCQWRMLPNDFPPYATVHSFYRRCRERGIWEDLMRELVTKDRLQSGRSANPSYAVIDLQSLKTTGAADKPGFVWWKKVKGRKRHIVVDTQGHLLHVSVHEANTHDTIAGCSVFEAALEKYPTLRGVCADAGYRKTLEIFVSDVLGRSVGISPRIRSAWAVLPKRWVAERTFAWLNPFRRLSKDYEIRTSSSENFTMLSHSRLLLRRLNPRIQPLSYKYFWHAPFCIMYVLTIFMPNGIIMKS